jgi:sporulation protein YlmC with PRC-barrel domain
MLMKHMAGCLLATAFVAAPALAQNPPPASAGTDRPMATGSGSTASGSSAMQPGAGSSSTAPSTMSSSPAAGTSSPQMSASSPGGMQGQFVTQMQPEQMMASKLIGTTVVGANNESIGDINDVIVDRKGQAMAVVIGVGGFLGIGEKDVAVSFQQLDFTASPPSNQQTSGTTTGGTAPAGSGNTVNTTGSTGAGSGTSAASGSNNAGGVPDRIALRMTKAELQAAPTFTTSGRDQNTSGASGGTTAPKQ